MSKEDKYIANSLKRGLQVIKLFDENHETLSLVEISKMLNVSRTIPYRLMFTLQDMGYVKQDPLTKRYQLTPKVMELGFSYLSSLRFPQLFQPYLEKAKDDIKASCYLSILDGTEVVYVGVASIPGLTSINVNPGLRLPAHATANGKLLIAFQSDQYINDLFKNGNLLEQFTDTTYTAKEKFMEELEQIREKGYAISKKEFRASVSSVAVPVYRNNEVFAAINVAIPANAFDSDFLEREALPTILATSKELSIF
ncbi:IclR family transcriptional regulator [Bacillus piscicola]|uniref:IclR family transcriptional regulator n=1 Tax=Bacillus piscicola TaxID=1632684 RepID=UPI001F090308|nr:IclR family transcriptional regulator [Bacillus piscicola]